MRTQSKSQPLGAQQVPYSHPHWSRKTVKPQGAALCSPRAKVKGRYQKPRPQRRFVRMPPKHLLPDRKGLNRGERTSGSNKGFVTLLLKCHPCFEVTVEETFAQSVCECACLRPGAISLILLVYSCFQTGHLIELQWQPGSTPVDMSFFPVTTATCTINVYTGIWEKRTHDYIHT